MIRTDSRKVEPGDTFVALKGIGSNGDSYIASAINKGAVKIVCESGQYEVETINVPDTREYLEDALLSEYGDIVSQMTIIGVTGTNGKTTTCYLISQLLTMSGQPCAYIGTIGFYLSDKVRDLPNTSVDICSLYELLLESYDNGFRTVALEASSQGLDMGRLNTIQFDVVAFTNLTEDHLDYHKTMDEYAKAKQILFKKLKPGGYSVVNIDDAHNNLFIGGKRFTYGFGAADYRIISFGGTEKTIVEYAYGGDIHSVDTDLIGLHNIYNLICAVACVNCLGLSIGTINTIIPELKAPAGRMEKIRYKGANIVIDYAHTPDAFEQMLSTADTFTSGKLYIVFGCTGDREREKRPVMTKIALGGCDRAIITIDDLHSEEPEHIFSDMLEGNLYDNYEICPDRKEAIRKGISLLKEGDSLLILGKGHEQFIARDGGNIPHNDKQAVLEIINE